MFWLERHRKFVVLVAVLSMQMAVCFTFYLGNLTTYILSVQAVRNGQYDQSQNGQTAQNGQYDLDAGDGRNGQTDTARPEPPFDIDPSWMVSIYMMGKWAGTAMVDFLARRIGLRMTNAVGVALSLASYFLTYFTVSHSIWATTLTFTGIGGVGNSMIFTANLVYVASWFRRNVSLVSSMLFGATALGGAIFNQIVTGFINPRNLSPDASMGEVSFFSQPEILERVPQVFLVLGALTAALQATALFFLSTPSSSSSSSSDKENGATPRDSIDEETASLLGEKGERRSAIDKDSIRTIEAEFYSSHMREHHSEQSASFRLMGNSGESSRRLHNGHNGHGPLFNSGSPHAKLTSSVDRNVVPTTVVDRQSTREGEAGEEEEEAFMTPMQMLKTPTFYFLEIACLAQAIGFITCVNYYKIFGQLWIEDDQFLAFIGSSMAFVITASMIACGSILDRFGMKATLVGHLALASVFLSLWFFVARLHRWLYLVWVMVMCCVFYNAFVIQPIATLRYFGKRHYATNYGFVQGASFLVFLGGPPLYTVVIASLGWFWLFFIVAVICFVAMVILIWKMAP